MKWLTPPMIAEQLGVTSERVRGWILAEQLRAINLSDSSRPQWKVAVEDFKEFCDLRANVASKKKNPRQPFGKRRRKSTDAIEFFK